MIVYDTTVLPAFESSCTADFGATPNTAVDEILFTINEPKLVERLAESSLRPLERILSQVEIDLHSCWIATNVPTEKLIDSSLITSIRNEMAAERSDIAGDIDLIVGRMDQDSFSFDYLTAFQVKVRRMDASDRLRHFGSGEGTGQARFTSLMGFDRTFLLHLFVREPKPVTGTTAPSWNPITNSDFGRAMRASYGLVRARLNRALYGYCWLGWGQAFGREPDQTGGLMSDVVLVPPFRPKNDHREVVAAREMMTASLINLLTVEGRKRSGLSSRPFIMKWPVGG